MMNRPILRLLTELGLRKQYTWEGVEITKTFDPEKRFVDLLSLIMVSALRNASIQSMVIESRLPSFVPVSKEECDEAVAIFNQEQWHSIDVLNGGGQKVWRAMRGLDKYGRPNVVFWGTSVPQRSR